MIDSKILAIIPARAGSKRLPLKNIKPIFGKPLVAWTVEQALQCKYFNKVIVSTDCKDIAGIAESHGAEVPFMRPDELSQDHSSSMDLVEHALTALSVKGESFDIVALLEPTSPLRFKSDLDQAMSTFLEKIADYDALISVGEIEREHPAIIKSIHENKIQPFLHNCEKKAAYFPYGVIYASKVSTLLQTKTFYQARALAYKIARWQNFEIDDLVDFHCVERIMEVFHKEL